MANGRAGESLIMGAVLMIRTLFVSVFLVFATVAHGDVLTLHSTYEAAGTNPDGSKYSGTVAIKVISDKTFTIHWRIGDATYDGFGMRDGDALAATYTLDGKPGLVIYKVGEGGVLAGFWVVRGENEGGTERLTPSN
jgi:hypothetical protein